jgi:hypothetical protein
MTYGERLKTSFAHFKKSPSLLNVMIMEFILSVLLGILFFVGNLAIIVWLNQTGFQALGDQALDMEAFIAVALNAKTIITLVLVLIVEGLIFVYMDSFFKAGFYGMLKNAVHDGSTTFQEFVPEAKRYWHPMFRFLLLRYVLLIVFGIPLIVAAISVAGTTPALISSSQWVLLGVTFTIFIVAMLLIFFWLFYGEAVIVFEDADTKQAVKDSGRIVKQHLGATIGAFLIVVGIILVATVVESVLALPFDALAEKVGSTAFLRDVVKFLLNIITISAGIIASIFIFLTYDNFTNTRSVRKPTAKMTTKKPIRRKA